MSLLFLESGPNQLILRPFVASINTSLPSNWQHSGTYHLFTYTAFVTIKQINPTLTAMLVQKQECFFFLPVQVFVAPAFRPSPYTLVVAVILLKKRCSVFKLKFLSISLWLGLSAPAPALRFPI